MELAHPSWEKGKRQPPQFTTLFYHISACCRGTGETPVPPPTCHTPSTAQKATCFCFQPCSPFYTPPSPPRASDFKSISSLSLRALKDTFSVLFTPRSLCVFRIWVSLGESVSELVAVQPPCAAAEAGGHSVTVTVQQGEKAQPGCKETKGTKQLNWIKSFSVQLPSLWTSSPTFYTPEVISE